MRAERSKYGLRATKKPAKQTTLSSTVDVRNEAGEQGYCYVNFEPCFVEAVGKVMTRGVGPEDKAFLRVVFYPRTEQWLVSAVYLDGTGETLLWRTAERPAWLNFYRKRVCLPSSADASSQSPRPRARRRQQPQ